MTSRAPERPVDRPGTAAAPPPSATADTPTGAAPGPDLLATDGSARATGPSAVSPTLRTAAAYAWRLIVVLAAAALFISALIRLRVLVVPVILAVFLATLLVPLKRVLTRRGVQPTLASVLVFLGSLLVLGGVVGGVVEGTRQQFPELRASAEEGLAEVEGYLVNSRFGIEQADIDRFRDNISEAGTTNRDQLTEGALAGAHVLVEVVTGFVLMLFTLFFFVKDGPRIWDWFVRLASPRLRPRIHLAGERAFATLGGYMRGTAFVALVDAVLIGLALLILGVPLVAPLAVIVFLGAFIPIVGATLASVLAVLVALVSNGLVTALVIAGVVIAVNQLEAHVLSPIVLGRAVSVHPLAIALSLAAGALLAGVIGAVLSVPLTAVTLAVVNALRQGEAEEAPPAPARKSLRLRRG